MTWGIVTEPQGLTCLSGRTRPPPKVVRIPGARAGTQGQGRPLPQSGSSCASPPRPSPGERRPLGARKLGGGGEETGSCQGRSGGAGLGPRPRPRPGGLPRPIGNPALRGGRGGRGGGEAERADTRARNSRGGRRPRRPLRTGPAPARGGKRRPAPRRGGARTELLLPSGPPGPAPPGAAALPPCASPPSPHSPRATGVNPSCLGCPLCARGVASITGGFIRVWELIHKRCLERCLVNPQ